MPLIPVGSTAPDVTGPLADGGTFRLSDYRGKPLVLYFYPGDFTPGCTKEACSFRDAYSDLVGMGGAQIVGVSVDPPDSHAKFAKRYGLPFPLVSDADNVIARAFGATFFGNRSPLRRRTTFVIDAQGIVRGVFDHQLLATKHVTDVRACLASLPATTPAAT